MEFAYSVWSCYPHLTSYVIDFIKKINSNKSRRMKEYPEKKIGDSRTKLTARYGKLNAMESFGVQNEMKKETTKRDFTLQIARSPSKKLILSHVIYSTFCRLSGIRGRKTEWVIWSLRSFSSVATYQINWMAILLSLEHAVAAHFVLRHHCIVEWSECMPEGWLIGISNVFAFIIIRQIECDGMVQNGSAALESVFISSFCRLHSQPVHEFSSNLIACQDWEQFDANNKKSIWISMRLLLFIMLMVWNGHRSTSASPHYCVRQRGKRHSFSTLIEMYCFAVRTANVCH